MEKFKILFVCLGNICRSPAAEAIMKSKVVSLDLSNQFEFDSAGTIGCHAGEKADSRMIAHARKRGIEITSLSRKVNVLVDFNYYDLIVAMNDNNYKDLLLLENQAIYPSARIVKMCSFCKQNLASQVSDPYYGGDNGFENVLDILKDACEGLIEYCISNAEIRF